jgi:endonuclease G
MSDKPKIEIDPDYSNRKGYQSDFLGSLTVALPDFSVHLTNCATTDNGSYELKYEHFSLVFNKIRKLAIFTAVNIDGLLNEQIKDQVPRPADKWFYDERIDKKFQLDDDFYGVPFDRGHLVRREDPIWGELLIAKKANDDTFHWTNCSPQHEDYNRADKNNGQWNKLESFILKSARLEDLKLIVFSGPVFRDNDKVLRNEKIPSQYWKVVVGIKEGGKPSATAFLTTQSELVETVTRGFPFEEFKTYQVKLGEIEALTKLKFNLSQYEPPSVRTRFGATKIEKEGDIVF